MIVQISPSKSDYLLQIEPWKIPVEVSQDSKVTGTEVNVNGNSNNML